MDTSQVFVKTDKGHEEIDHRTFHLGFKLRTALIVVDGESPAELLLAKIPGDGAALLEELWRNEFIVPVGGSASKPPVSSPAVSASSASESFDLDAAKRSAVKAIEAILGPSGESLAIAIERTKSHSDYVAQVQKTRDIVKSMGGQRRADEFWSKTGL